jgi:hypothetical protein
MDEKWIIEDWTGRRLFPDHTFPTFDDGMEFLHSQFPDQRDWDDVFVEQLFEEE